jgi:hypothetical protein
VDDVERLLQEGADPAATNAGAHSLWFRTGR